MDEQPSIQSGNGDDGSYYYYDYDAEIVPCNDTYLCMRRVSDTEVIRYYIRNWGILIYQWTTLDFYSSLSLFSFFFFCVLRSIRRTTTSPL